ncbi:VOC family protein [Solirubrobacter taibaiensis]|nr:VOC family protein [Solirubrobacter taibaiensis]
MLLDELATLREVRLNLLVLRCADPNATRRFYECLGVAFSEHAHGSGPVHYAHEDDDFVFELYPAGAGGTDRAGVGLVIGDLEAAAEQLREAGFNPDPIAERPWGTTFVARDPDGRRVEVQASA